MKKTFTLIIAAVALTVSSRASDLAVKINDVHMCCDSCVKGAQKAVANVEGLTAEVDKDGRSVTLTGANRAIVQKGAEALVAGGFFGKSSDGRIKIPAHTGAKGQKVQTLKVQGVHLCCGKCVKAVNEAVNSVAGVKGNTATKGAESFEVTGDFNDKELFDALQKAGLAGKTE